MYMLKTYSKFPGFLHTVIYSVLITEFVGDTLIPVHFFHISSHSAPPPPFMGHQTGDHAPAPHTNFGPLVKKTYQHSHLGARTQLENNMHYM